MYMYINNYMELRNQAEGVDPESPEAQVFTPVTGTKSESPLSKQKSLVLHSKYGWIPLSDGNQVREKGELEMAMENDVKLVSQKENIIGEEYSYLIYVNDFFYFSENPC